MSYVCMGDNGFSSTFGLDTAAGFFAGDVFAGSRMLLSAFFDFNCDGGTDVECWNLDMEEVLLADDTAGIGCSGFATDDNVVAVAAEVAADFSAMATFSFILARRMLLLVDLTLFGLEAEEWAAIFFRVDDAVAYLGWAELVVFVALFKPFSLISANLALRASLAAAIFFFFSCNFADSTLADLNAEDVPLGTVSSMMDDINLVF
mmetsp:Transcript_32531/g.47977  ORF Transcript_32531/g.47977 Transcript_32531/m.47977 type:complete len:205 (+) Transcript_32531:497-1111(+)